MTWDYNDYYIDNGFIAQTDNSVYSNFSSWKAYTGGESNGLNINPYFASDSSYQVYQRGLNGAGIPIPGILLDIEGQIRNSQAPDIGCDEFMVDFGITQLLSPTLECMHGPNDSVTLLLRQFGDVPFTDIKIAYNVNGGTPVIDTIQGSIFNDLVYTFKLPYDMSATGTYTFKAWLVNNFDDNVNNDTLVAVRYSKPNPSVQIGFSPGCAGQMIPFTGLAAVNPGYITSYFWRFGDGDSAILQNPSHRYDSSGTYMVSLRAYTDEGCYNEASTSISLIPTPVANFESNDVCLGLPITFTNLSTSSQGSLTYLWDFGDGTGSSQTEPQHTYPHAGLFQVMLLADNGQCTDTAIKTVTVSDAPLLTTQPLSTAAMAQNSVSFSLQALYTATYQWQYSPDGGFNWSELVDGNGITGSDSNLLHIASINPSMDGYLYRCLLSGECQPQVLSDVAMLVVTPFIPTHDIYLKTLLQGAYVGSGEMATSVLFKQQLSLSQPYQGAPWWYEGNEGIQASSPDIIDWVLVELRRSTDTTVARAAGLLLVDGRIVGSDLSSPLRFTLPIGYYYLTVIHRNHLPVMTSMPLLVDDSVYYDFRDRQAFPSFGDDVVDVWLGIVGMISGDLNFDRSLKYSGSNNDRSLILQRILQNVGGTSITATTSGYYKEDLNFDGIVKYSGAGNDPAKIIQNIVQLSGSNAINTVYYASVPAAHIEQAIQPWYCGQPLLDDRDGQVYKTMRIGNQCWMAENLNLGTMIPGSQNMMDNGIIEKYCYNDDTSNCTIYGALYQWNEMMQYVNQETNRGICPQGWLLPTDAHWKLLEGTVDSLLGVGNPIWDNSGARGSDAGKRLKSTRGWYLVGNGVNSGGFKAVPGSLRFSPAFPYDFLTRQANFWTSTQSSGTNAWRRQLSYQSQQVDRASNSKTYGMSVRCVRE